MKNKKKIREQKKVESKNNHANVRVNGKSDICIKVSVQTISEEEMRKIIRILDDENKEIKIMMYAIYNSDGSRKLTNLNEIITKGSNGVTEIFIAVENYPNTDYSASANFKLPDGTINSLVGVATSKTFDTDTYAGWLFTLSSAQTAYVGDVFVSIKVEDNNDLVLFSFPLTLTVNPASVDLDSTIISLAQYQNLLNALASKQDKFVTTNVRGYETLTDAYNDIDNLAIGQYVYVKFHDKFFVKVDEETLNIVYAAIVYNGDSGTATLQERNLFNISPYSVVILHNDIRYYYSQTVSGSGLISYKAQSLGSTTVGSYKQLLEYEMVYMRSSNEYYFGTSTVTSYYDKSQIDYLLKDISTVYKIKGTKTVAEINALTPDSTYNGYVYNIDDDGTITTGTQGNLPVKAGDNVVLIWDSDNSTYSWDLLSSSVDLSQCVLLTGNQTIAGNKTFSNKAIFSDANLYNGYLTTNSKNYFARVGVTTGQYVTYKLPYNYADVGAENYTFEVMENKVTSLSGSSTDVQYPSAKCVWDNLQDVREVAEGKCRTYILSYAQTSLDSSYFDGTNKVYKPNGEEIDNWNDFNTYVNGGECLNPYFNTQNNLVDLTQEYILTTDKIVIILDDPDIHDGDIFLVRETDVPDRWVQVGTYDLYFYKLETAKVDLSNYVTLDGTQSITGAKTFTNSTTFVSNVILNSLFYPYTNQGVNLGTSDNTFYNAYISGTIYAGDINVSGEIYLGNSSTFIQYSTTYYCPFFSTGAVFNGNILPNDATTNLGQSGNKWQHLYLSGNLTNNGSRTVDGLSGKTVSPTVESNSAELPYDTISTLTLSANTTLTLQTKPTGCEPEYRAWITTSAAITLTFTGVSTFLTNDDSIVITNGTNTTVALASGITVEISIENGHGIVINHEVA